MAIQWTKQQEQAIQVRGRSAIVSAAAGSGKTAALVERLLQILSDPNPDTRVEADRMIVVTFTKDAAAQMKQRLTKKMSETLDDMNRRGLHHDLRYDWLMQQRSAVGNAKISTIHSFCFEVIRENADACGVSSQFVIADPARETIYQKRALQTVLDHWSKHEKEKTEILFRTLCAKHDSELEKVILLLDEYLNSLAFPEYWMTQAKRLCETEEYFIVHQIRKLFCEKVEDCISYIEGCRIFAQNVLKVGGTHPYEGTLNSDIQMMKTHIAKINKRTPEELVKAPMADKGSFVKVYSPKGDEKSDVDSEAKETFQDIRKIYKKKYTTLCDRYLGILKFYAEDREIEKQVIPLLLELTEQYQAALWEEKKKQNAISFNDAERLVLRLAGTIDENGVIHRTAFAETLSQQYCLIMVDEYQDSNNKQDYLFKLLSHDCQISDDGKTLRYGDNAFLVGDVKQSIYSFRQANPENFRRAIAESTPLSECHDKEMARIYFNQNFRSAEGILDFVNAVFRTIMSERCGDMLYDEHEQLNFCAEHYQKLDKQHQGVKILLPKRGETPSELDLQAECIADTISDMIARRVPVMLADGRTRDCEYGDFCILLRSVRKSSEALTEALRKRGIPFSCAEGNGFLTLPEIRLIRSLLRIVDNPMTDVSMAAVLLSPVCGFTPEDLAMLKVWGTGRRLYLQIKNLAQQNSVLSEKCRLFLQQFSQMRELVDKLPLEDFIYEIYEMTDFMSLQSLYDNPEQRRDNLELFAGYAKEYREHADLTAQSCLSGWLRYLEHLSESEEPFRAGSTSIRTNYVTIKTIHGSKGLEYPFVFLAHLEKAFFRSPNPPAVQPYGEGLLGLHVIDRKRCLKIRTASYHYIGHMVSQKEKSEEMRLFYVAMTRAKQELFLVMDEIYTGCTPKTHVCNMGELLSNSPELVPVLAAEAGCMRDWIVQFLLSGPEAPCLRKAMDEGVSNASALVGYVVWYEDKPLQTVQKEQRIRTEAAPDTELLSDMQKQLAFEYTFSALPSKYTVTQLSHPDRGLSERITTPEFMREDAKGRQQKLQGAARGTAIHKIMQFLDFSQVSADTTVITEKLRQMHESGLLSSVEEKAIRPEKLAAFFGTAFYQRIAAADRIEKEYQLFVRIGELNLPETSALRQDYEGTDGILIGTVDLLFHEPDGWVLVDYKTDQNKSEETFLEDYSLQLGLYQKALERILDEPVKEACIYAFELDKTIAVDLNQISYD